MSNSIHTSFLRWLSDISERASIKNININLLLPGAAFGVLVFDVGEVSAVLLSKGNSYPNGKLLIGVSISDHGDGREVIFSCTALPHDLGRATNFIAAFAKQMRSSDVQKLQELIADESSNVEAFPNLKFSPWYAPYESDFLKEGPLDKGILKMFTKIARRTEKAETEVGAPDEPLAGDELSNARQDVPPTPTAQPTADSANDESPANIYTACIVVALAIVIGIGLCI